MPVQYVYFFSIFIHVLYSHTFSIAGKIIDYTKLKIPLVDDCLNETAGTGVDCIIDNGG